MHVDNCELGYLIAPVIHEHPERILVTGNTPEAMAACPGSAIVWCEDPSAPPQPQRNLR